MTATEKKSESSREAGLSVAAGAQGVGKTYLNMRIIKNYVTDNFENKIRGRKCLIIDTNGEYTKDQFEKNDVPGFSPKLLAVKDIPEWSFSSATDCRRIDAKSLSIPQKKELTEFALRHFRNGMLVLEDINTYITKVTHMEEVIGSLVNLRHRAVDVLISYQSLRAVEPRIYQNARWIRMHNQADNVSDIKDKLPDPRLYKIAQLIVQAKYSSGDERFYLYIHNLKKRIQGAFSKKDFAIACDKYISLNKKELKECITINRCSENEARNLMTKELYKQYYGNS